MKLSGHGGSHLLISSDRITHKDKTKYIEWINGLYFVSLNAEYIMSLY